MANLKIVPPQSELDRRRNAVAVEATCQIEALMTLGRLAEGLDCAERDSAVRTIFIRARQVNSVVMSILGGDNDAMVGEWELDVFGALQGPPTLDAEA